MTRELITSWTDYQAAIDRILALAESRLCIYDEDLAQLRLDSGERLECLRRVLLAGHGEALRIAVRNGLPLRDNHPRLQGLLNIYGHLAGAQETPPQLAHLRDNMIVVDGRHALVRFDRDQARAKLLIDAAEEVRPYTLRFQEIWAEGGERVSGAPLGL